VAIVFYNDHGLNFLLDTMPRFAVGAADVYHNDDEGWGLPVQHSFQGHPKLSWHLIDCLVEDEFVVTTCQTMKVDHAVVVPFQLAYPDAASWPVKIIPIAINSGQHPRPSATRCLALGRAVRKALETWGGDEKIVVTGTGGLSHPLEGERAGIIHKDYDLFCLDNPGPHPEALTQHSPVAIVELSGSQDVEILDGIAARCALGLANPLQKHRNYHIPISNTAAATLLQ
jgi:protocatechuate 4,5-dioxygenase beta chain